jgi:ribosomal-protein-alanine N-acetyltransferase
MRLTTDRLVLREFEGSDLSATYQYEEQPGVERYQAFDLSSPERVREYIRAAIATASEEPRHTYDLAVTLREDGSLIGRGGLQRSSGEPRDAFFWFILDPRHWNKGYVTEAARALFGYAFDELRLHRVWGECDPQSEGSARMMEKLGMTREAHLRENAHIDGQWRDTVIYALLDREWAAQKKATLP